MSSSCSGNQSDNNLVDQGSQTLPNDVLMGSEDAKPDQSKTLNMMSPSPIITDLVAQCEKCHKWRLIPSMEKYEIIREKQLETPFSCETASEWNPNISCDDPEYNTSCDIRAIDVPCIPHTPIGWERVVKFQSDQSEKFADVYYYAPSPSEKKKGERLRSIDEVTKFLDNHPEYVREGVNSSQFSFQLPIPHPDDYVKKSNVTAEVGSMGLVSQGDHGASEQV